MIHARPYLTYFLTDSQRGPMFYLPLDLVFLHVVLSITLHHCRPRRLFRSFSAVYWSWAAKQFRLSSYMYGGRYSDEETDSSWPLSPFWNVSDATDGAKFTGHFRRVPATDDIPHVQCMKTKFKLRDKGVWKPVTWGLS